MSVSYRAASGRWHAVSAGCGAGRDKKQFDTSEIMMVFGDTQKVVEEMVQAVE